MFLIQKIVYTFIQIQLDFIKYIKDEFKYIAIEIIKKYPDMITNYNRNLKILYTIKDNELHY